MDKKTAHRKAERAYVSALENDLKRAIGLLHLANPDNRAWVEARDAFLEEMGYTLNEYGKWEPSK